MNECILVFWLISVIYIIAYKSDTIKDIAIQFIFLNAIFVMKFSWINVFKKSVFFQC